METEKVYQKATTRPSGADAERLLQALIDRGYSSTRPRRAVAEVLAAAAEPLDPATILQRGQALYPRLGLTTVYRTLNLLIAAGLVHKTHLDDGCHTYALAEHAHRHHLICLSCARTVEFEGCDLGPMFQSLSRVTGYAIEGHRLELYGLCPACQHTPARRTA